ncbi:hypothetical protein E6C76_08570 [Pseudothauera nasutitermitis]|uniref:ParB/Sulfiredoxin domain-containing protein n=1 Tax=Pseudothauera nasutitermitis TaxID=2565930 RepID=A0A4V3WC38_9RHOO|nr:hypothetical protein [Pseudothauera nasutitermitis]THF65615.1 hypothetical protein E6C76_08570 [Pseudothauera nasutitermitis]
MANKKKEADLVHEDVEVSFSKLHFDPVNPRGEPEADEGKVRELFGSQSETLILATHMAEHGQNPLDRLAIIEHSQLPGHYLVREGNRRLCAMQLLRDPERAPSEELRKAYRRLAESGRQIPSNVQAVLFYAKGKERVWMSVKHEGPQNGLGTLSWGATEKTRFNREGETGKTRPKNPNRQAEALLTYAVNEELISAEERRLISLTTVTRYLPNVRTALALLNKEDCTTNARREEFNAALQRFLKDAKQPSEPNGVAPVHSRSNSDERKDYAEKLRGEGFSPRNRDQDAYDPSAVPPPKPEGKGKAAPRNPVHPGKRKQLVLSSFVVPVKDPVLLRLVAEGKELNPDEARFSCNYLNRVILERVVHLYATKHGIGRDGDFGQVVQRVIDHAKASAQPPSKGIANVLTKTADKKTSYSYEQMSNPVHGGSIPSGADNKSNWENLQPVLEYLLSKLK